MFICCERVVCSGPTWARSCGVGAKRVGDRDESWKDGLPSPPRGSSAAPKQPSQHQVLPA